MAHVPRSRGARQSRDGARGCLTAGRKARGRGATGRPCASLAWDGRLDGAGGYRRSLLGRGHSRLLRTAASGGLDAGRGAARTPRTFFQGGGRSARGGAAEPATSGAAESRGVGGGRAMARAAQVSAARRGGCAGLLPPRGRYGLRHQRGPLPRRPGALRPRGTRRCSGPRIRRGPGGAGPPGGSVSPPSSWVPLSPSGYPGPAERGRPLPPRTIVRSWPAGALGDRQRRPERPLWPVAAAATVGPFTGCPVQTWPGGVREMQLGAQLRYRTP